MDKDLLYMIGGAFYMGFEYWIGKTDKTKSGSLVEAFAFGLKFAVGRLMKGKK